MKNIISYLLSVFFGIYKIRQWSCDYKSYNCGTVIMFSFTCGLE